jgi:ferritin-like metal-binding protein YciE
MKNHSDTPQGRGNIGLPESYTITDFVDLFVAELKNLYGVEKIVVDFLPEWAKSTQDESIIHAMVGYLDVSKARRMRLERVLDHFGQEPNRFVSPMVQALAEDADATLNKIPPGGLRDAATIMVMQRLMHHKITGYGTLCAFAEILRKSEAERLMNDAIIEEREADEELTEIAISKINARAALENPGKSHLFQVE